MNDKSTDALVDRENGRVESEVPISVKLTCVSVKALQQLQSKTSVAPLVVECGRPIQPST
jgi:hypothetical protein